jgi:hypothetical protein
MDARFREKPREEKPESRVANPIWDFGIPFFKVGFDNRQYIEIPQSI